MNYFIEKKRRFFNQTRKCEKNSSKKAPQILNFSIFLRFLTLKWAGFDGFLWILVKICNYALRNFAYPDVGSLNKQVAREAWSVSRGNCRKIEIGTYGMA